ncbi:MAG: VOC family protein [Haloquadratum sp.]|jgi:lactoylglutathione lyase|nr:VOC family protein [Haloferacaceae archaeon]MDR9445010.1 VOC family protein [Haloquadratum sp.]
MQIIHTNLHVTDLDTTIAFYTEQLGLSESWGFDSPDGTTRHRYVADEAGVEIQLTKVDGEEELTVGTAWDHLALRVDDVDAAFAAIENHGVVKEPGDQPEAGVRTAFILDPDGHKIELVGPLE